jgi:hypothetical protein
MLGVPTGRVYVDDVALGLALQIVLGQGRPFIWALALVAHEEDLSVEAFVAQPLGRLGAGQAGAQDHKRLRRCHRSRPALCIEMMG